MMKVKSFVVGTVNGIVDSMKLLDEFANEIRNINIHSITDTIVPPRVHVRTMEEKTAEVIIRVIVYTPVTT